MTDTDTNVIVDGVTYVGPPESGYGSLAYSLCSRAGEVLRREAQAMTPKRRIVVAHEAIETAVSALTETTPEVRADLIAVLRRLEAAYKELL
jgi:hypothetical protein